MEYKVVCLQNKSVTPQNNRTSGQKQNQYHFDPKELWRLLRYYAGGPQQQLNRNQVNLIFQALGLFIIDGNIKPYLKDLGMFNSFYLVNNDDEEYIEEQPDFQAQFKPNNLTIVDWIWRYCTIICQNEDIISMDVLFEILSNILDLKIDAQSASTNVTIISQFHFGQINDKKNSKEIRMLMQGYAQKLIKVIEFLRSQFLLCNTCTVYGIQLCEPWQDHQCPKIFEVSRNSLAERCVTTPAEQSKESVKQTKKKDVFEKLFDHSKVINQKMKIFQQTKTIIENMPHPECTFQPTTIPKPDFRTVTPKLKSLKKQNILTEIKTSVTPTKNSAIHFRNVSEIGGVKTQLDRMKNARDQKEMKERFWIEERDKLQEIAKKSQNLSPFNLATNNRVPQPKPVIYVDVEVSTGKTQRLGLYGFDNLDYVSSKFAKAHSLNKTQQQALKIRLEKITNQCF